MLLVEASDGSALIIESLEAIRQQLKGKGKQLILVINKSDIGDPQVFDDEQLQANEHACRISAKHHQNIDQLRETLISAVSTGSIRHQDVVITNIRHYNALHAASGSLERVLDGLSDTLPQDLLAQDIRETLHYLGEITGEVTTDEILGNIFKNFCIGK
jgi:tRNA modification GTPase